MVIIALNGNFLRCRDAPDRIFILPTKVHDRTQRGLDAVLEEKVYMRVCLPRRYAPTSSTIIVLSTIYIRSTHHSHTKIGLPLIMPPCETSIL